MYWNLTDKDRLVKTIDTAKKLELLEKFLSEIFTKKELSVSMVRLRAVCMLNDGASYKEIEKFTGLSSATIARLAKTLLDRNTATQKILRDFKKEGKKYSE